ncbi:hypothetical protein BGZ97_007871 [Linnemannia gamsii]|uniref:Uncharacterized protein n=1 Tax=Linnemannia gamsii TaxID=64522 RepID=A0A9P6QQ09_9FUNG|nr:hypothetical protein BGZ97_007871 [Linnemannia gamsii]
MKLNQQLAAANEKFDALVERIRTLEANEFKNKAMLDVLVIYGHFFTAITTELEPKLSEIVFRLNALDECTKEFDEQLDAIPRTRQPIGQAQLNIALQTLRTELTTAINESTQVARTAAITSAYPTEANKVLFAIFRLGTDTAASKLMELYIPKFHDPIELRPPLISNLKVFLTYMSKNFGITNSHVVAEINL